MGTIELANLNEQLSKLWDEKQGEKKVRASLFNLIIYAQKSDSPRDYEDLVRSVVSKFPCRIMLIIHEEKSSEAYLRTSVSSETLGEGENQAYCEIIRIEVAGDLVERVPFIAIAQLLPDLPVYLLWTQDPTSESTILPHLERYADRIIFDSESSDNLQSYSQAVLALFHRFKCAIGDLNWSAISGWRELLSATFDSQDSFQTLAESKIIRIHYNRVTGQSHRYTEIEAAYLQAWLASRLNWKFRMVGTHEGNIRITYQTPTREIVILLTPQESSELAAGSILSLEIESAHNKGHYDFKRHLETRQVSLQFSDKSRCDLPSCNHLSGLSEGQEIVEEIFQPSAGPHYREMLELLTQIPWTRE